MLTFMKKYGNLIYWLMVVIGVFLLLDIMFRYHFGTLHGPLFFSVMFALVVLAIGAIFLRIRSRDLIGSTTNAFESSHAVWAAIRDLLISIDGLSDDVDEARAQIDEIRTAANTVGNWLAGNASFIGPQQVEVQMALGDVVNLVERVWTTLADEHPDAARAAYTEARAHVERVRTFLPASTVTV